MTQKIHQRHQINHYLATYTGKSTAAIEQYLKEDVDLHFLIFAAAINPKRKYGYFPNLSKIRKRVKKHERNHGSAKLDPRSSVHEVKNIQHGHF